MRYSAVFKFFAVILCAAVILSAVGSGVGLLALTECGLYNRSFEAFYQEDIESKLQSTANGIAARYASINLGGASQTLTWNLLGYGGSLDAFFEPARRGYVLKNEAGEIVQTEELYEQFPAEQTFTADANTRYIKVLKTEPVEETEPLPSEPADIQIHTLPSGNTEISNVTLEFADGSLEQHELPKHGYLEVRENGTFCLTTDYLNSPGLNEGKRLEFITLLDMDRRTAYEAYGANSLLLGYTRRDGQSILMLPGSPFASERPDQQPEGFGNAYVKICPETTVNVTNIIVDYSEGSREHYTFADSAVLEPMEDGSIWFYAENMEPLMFVSDPFGAINIQFFGEDGYLVYDARGSYDTQMWYYPQEYHREGTTKIILPGSAYLNRLYGTAISNGDFTAYDAIPTAGAEVAEINVSYGTLEEGATASEGVAGSGLGHLLRDGKGNPRFEARQTGLLDIPEDMLIISISFLNENGELLYEASCPSGVGTLKQDINGYLVFQAVTPDLAAPEETSPKPTKPVDDTTIRGVVRKNTDVYSMPSAGGRTDMSLLAGTEVYIWQQETIGDQRWAQINLGWINMEDLVLEQMPETEPQVVKEPVSDPVQAVAKENLTVFRAPNGETPVGEVKKGDAVTVLSQESYNGMVWALTDTGWVQAEHLTMEVPAPAALDAAPEADPAPAAAAETVPQETLPAETVPEVIPAVTEPEEIPAETAAAAKAVAAPEEDPLAGYDPDQIQTCTYFDEAAGQSVKAYYVMEPLSGYTLELQLAAGGDRAEMLWMLLGLAYALRQYLLLILGASLALLGLCVVYLCCAAAHRRGSDVIRAGGLNRIPLDGYLVVVGCLLAGFVLLGYEGTEYFIRNGLKQIGMGLLLGSAYLCSLLLVGIGFAFVAQIKTPRGFWWRNSLCGRCVLFGVRLCRKTVMLLSSQGGSLAKRGARGIGKICLTLWVLGQKTALRVWDTAKRLCLWAWDLILRLFRWTRGNLARLFGLLPITWQFLTTGFTLVFFLYIMIRTYKVGYILLGFGVFFAVILYAASAFAILLESAKRMSKGDLDTKVDDRMLIGGFREFAHRLNDLAGVAVIAAQKQLKSERMKTELITNVSHDIKTPLTSIINYVDLLQKPHTDREQAQYLEVLDRQSQRLKKLIDDLMEMSKASTGNLSVDIERVDAAETVNQALGEFADKLERAQLLPVFRQPEEPVYMMADGRLVWRVMSNLLGNAVKYALPGTRIYLDLMEMDRKVIISMKNISREELNVNAEELMERFVRGDASRNTEGSGLGLNIAQSLMELQRGQLQILVDGDLFKVTLIFPGA